MYKHRRSHLVASAAIFAAISTTALADEWIVGNGTFNTPANWSTGLPGSTDTAVFGVSGGQAPSYTVTFTSNPTNAQLRVTALPTFDLAGHTYTIGAASTTAVQVGQGGALAVGSSTSTGTLKVTGTIIVGGVGGTTNSTLTFQQGTQLSGGILQIGNDGGGEFNINTGASASTTGTTIGSVDSSYTGSGATGSATISGAGSTWTDTATISVGASAPGSLTIKSGASVGDVAGLVGQNSGGSGTVAVDGAGSAWNNSNELSIGNNGSASLSITSGGSVTSGGAMQIGTAGNVGVSGTGSQLTGLDDYVINGILSSSPPTIAFSISNGAKVTGGGGEISSAAIVIDNGQWTNTGDMTLSHSSITLSNGGTLTNGNSYGESNQQQISITGANSKWTTGGFDVDGTINVKSGGALAAGDIQIGADNDSAVVVDGASSTLTSSGLMRVVGGTSAGTTFTISNGASVTNGSAILNVGAGPLVATLQDSGSSWTTGSFEITPGNDTLNVSNGTLTATSFTFDVGAPAPVVNFSGGTMKLGSIQLNGGTANFKWTAGTLNLTASDLLIGQTGALGQSLTLGLGKILQVSGAGHSVTIDGPGNGGFLALGGGSASIDSNLTVASAGVGGLMLGGASSVSDGSVCLGTLAGSFATVVVGNSASDNPNWTTTGSFYVGGNATASGGHALLTIKRGSVSVGGTLLVYPGQPTVTLSGGSLTVGALYTASAQFKFTGGTLTVSNSDFTVSNTGTPSFAGTVFELPTGTTLNVTGATNKFLLQSSQLLLDGGTLSARNIDLTGGNVSFFNGTINIDTGVLSAGSASTFAFGGPVTGTGSFVKSGSGTLRLDAADSYSGPTTVNAGTLELNFPAALPAGANLIVGAGATVKADAQGAGPKIVLQLNSLNLTSFVGANVSQGKLDLSDNDLILHNGVLNSIKTQIKQGYNGGTWTGNGITSSLAPTANPKTALGYATGLTETFDGQTIVSTDVIVKYTLVGDSSLDGSVNFTDLLTVAQNYNHTSTTWQTGDFNYDGTTNFSDLLMLAQNYNKAITLTASELSQLNTLDSSFANAFSQAQSAIPEPAGFMMMLASLGVAVRRRSRRGSSGFVLEYGGGV